uniref:hypothetical protein n=1 Tax=Ramlibacter sp. TaxID=1917967 RepID=UPI002579673B
MSFTGASQSVVVPQGATYVTITATGAGGAGGAGGGQTGGVAGTGGPGGGGGIVSGKWLLSALGNPASLTTYVGGAGQITYDV